MTDHSEGDPEKIAVKRVREALAKRLWIRFHMSLILGVVVLAGVLGSKLLLLIGVEWMAPRWGIAVLLGWAAFFVVARFWLWYAMKLRRAVDARTIESVDVALDGRREPPVAARAERRWAWPELLGDAAIIDEGCLVIVAVIALAGYAGYFLLQAPAILGEAAFNLILAGVLGHRIRPDESGTWATGLLRATWVPALLAFLVAVIVGCILDRAYPDAVSLREILR